MPGCEPVKDAYLVATVHDSIVAEVPADNWEEPVRAVIERMTLGVLPILKRMDCNFNVPLAAEATVGSRWGLSDIGEIK